MHYPFREEEEFDPQRMPGTRRSTHTPEGKDTTVHTADYPFCYDPACSCHSNQEAIQRVRKWFEEGLFTEAEAAEYIAGHTL